MSADYFTEVINNILLNNLKDGRETLVIIDEAHIIDDPFVFEELRLLLNFQSENRFLLTLLLMGQPELRDKVHQNKQLVQRIAMGFHLEPLNREEVVKYIAHRMEVAGGLRSIFTEDSIELIFVNSGGIPRRINQICDMGLVTGFGKQADKIDAGVIYEAVESLGV